MKGGTDMKVSFYMSPVGRGFGSGRGKGFEGGAPRRERSLEEISATLWLTPENASFSFQKGLLYATVNEKTQRVTLCRQFPMDMLWEFISVMDDEEHELGIIRSIDLFGEAGALLREELERRYYVRRIQSILAVKEQFGFSHWRVMTNEGEVRFTLKDTFQSISTVNGSRVQFTDMQGNRFEVESLEELDVKSRRRLELYL